MFLFYRRIKNTSDLKLTDLFLVEEQVKVIHQIPKNYCIKDK